MYFQGLKFGLRGSGQIEDLFSPLNGEKIHLNYDISLSKKFHF